MLKTALVLLYRLGMHLLRLLALCVGAYFGSIYPAEIWASERRAANLAAHHVPEMDPGVMASLALVLTVPILLALLVCELTRVWALEGKPLSPPAAAVLGAAATWPLGYGLPGGGGSTLSLFLTATLSVAAFYYARRSWLARMARRGAK